MTQAQFVRSQSDCREAFEFIIQTASLDALCDALCAMPPKSCPKWCVAGGELGVCVCVYLLL